MPTPNLLLHDASGRPGALPPPVGRPPSVPLADRLYATRQREVRINIPRTSLTLDPKAVSAFHNTFIGGMRCLMVDMEVAALRAGDSVRPVIVEERSGDELVVVDNVYVLQAYDLEAVADVPCILRTADVSEAEREALAAELAQQWRTLHLEALHQRLVKLAALGLPDARVAQALELPGEVTAKALRFSYSTLHPSLRLALRGAPASVMLLPTYELTLLPADSQLLDYFLSMLDDGLAELRHDLMEPLRGLEREVGGLRAAVEALSVRGGVR